MKFTLYTADVTGVASNCLYPHRHEIDSAEKLAEATAMDNVCGHFKNDYRNGENFLGCDCVMMDCDNDHSDDEADWMTPEKLSEAMPDVAFAAVPSRNHMKEKKGRKPRDKHHYVFPIPESSDRQWVANLKAGIQSQFPLFDANALDATRFAFGSKCKADDIFWQDGWLTVDEVVEPLEELEDDIPGKPVSIIPKGQRNQYLSRFAGRILKRYGECERAYQIFLEQADKCEEPLSERELKTIWGSAVKFFREKVVPSDGYVDPGDYNRRAGYLKPDDYSDIGQAKMLVREYGDELVYTVGTDYLRYDGKVWNESKQQAIGAMEEFLDLQLADAMVCCGEAKQACIDAGFDPEGVGKRDMANLSDDQLALLEAYLDARKYYAFVMKRRDMKYVTSALQAAKPMLEVKTTDLDSDPYLLNTPAGTLDLRKGLSSMRPHDPRDLITKITKYAPSDEGMDLWKDQLDKTFEGKADIIEYTQASFGEDIFGVVENEKLTIPFGGGRNGKSTVCNSIAGVLGSYAGTISADVLTANCRRNPKPEIAELKGKRFLIAGELEEGMRLSTSIIKQICSTDVVKGEKKYKDPFDFIPTHSIILFTNHLPKVSAMDDGIWRRLVVIPFNAKFEGKSDKKNYTNYLMEKAGGAILKWLIEGAKKAYDADFNTDTPAEVQAAIDKYRSDSDWFSHFVDECCEVGDSFKEKSGDLYAAYRAYCARVGDYTRSTTDFYNELEARGFDRHKRKEGIFVMGMRLDESDMYE
jgi:P4 family phage/plasmid primase-like protien